MKRFMSLALAAVLCMPFVGCSERQQLESEIDDVQDQREEIRETEQDAAEDIQQERQELEEEKQDVREEAADDVPADGTTPAPAGTGVE